MRTAFVLAGALCAVGCAGQSGGPVQLAAGQEGNRCTATVEGRPVVFNTDGRDFGQLRGRAVTISASADLPNRCAGILIAALQRAGTGPITYDFHGAAPQEAMAGDAPGQRMTRRAEMSWSGERPSFEKRSWRGEGASMSHFPSAKSGRPYSSWSSSRKRDSRFSYRDDG
jgi:hypothetical protein